MTARALLLVLSLALLPGCSTIKNKPSVEMTLTVRIEPLGATVPDAEADVTITPPPATEPTP